METKTINDTNTTRPTGSNCAGLLLVQTARAEHDINGNPRRAMIVREVCGNHARLIDVVCYSYGTPEAPASSVDCGEIDVDRDEWRRLEAQYADRHAPFTVWHIPAENKSWQSVGVVGRRWSKSAAAKRGREYGDLFGGTYAIEYRGEFTGPGRDEIRAHLEAAADLDALTNAEGVTA